MAARIAVQRSIELPTAGSRCTCARRWRRKVRRREPIELLGRQPLLNPLLLPILLWPVVDETHKRVSYLWALFDRARDLIPEVRRDDDCYDVPARKNYVSEFIGACVVHVLVGAMTPLFARRRRTI